MADEENKKPSLIDKILGKDKNKKDYLAPKEQKVYNLEDFDINIEKGLYIGPGVKLLSQGTFIVLYLIFIGVMFGMIKIIMKNINLFRISKEVLLEKKVWVITSSVFRIICIGYTIGFVVSLLNAFVIETFAKITV